MKRSRDFMMCGDVFELLTDVFISVDVLRSVDVWCFFIQHPTVYWKCI